MKDNYIYKTYRSGGANRRRGAQKSPMSPSMSVIFWLCLFIFLGSGGYLGYRYIVEPYLVNKANSAFVDAYEEEELDDDLPRNDDGTLKSFDDLRAMNKDVIGWVRVPATNIDYPVVQSPDEEDDYYLKHNIRGEKDNNGTIFANYDLRLEYGEKNPCIVLYGHHMKSGLMFNNLMKYDTVTYGTSFYKENPVVRFDTLYYPGEWVIFGIMKIDANVPMYSYANQDTPNPNYFGFIRLEFEDDDDFAEFITGLRARSMIDSASCVEVTTEDELLLLSTCSYEYDNYRTVVMARKVHPGETVDVSSAKKAANPVMPKSWKKGLGNKD